MADGNDRTDFFARLRNSLLDLSRRLQCNASEDTLDFVSFRLQQMLQHLVHFGVGLDRVRQSITDVVLLLENVQERRTRAGPQNVVAAPTGLVGRPKFDIPQEQLDYMLDYDIRVSDIATALGVSKSTIKRRIREYGISVRAQTVLIDSELDCLVREIQNEFPNAGYRRVYSQLRSRSVKVTQARVRESMHRTDPEGIAMRWLGITPRAVYSVRGPLSLWHIDGNHKLIR